MMTDYPTVEWKPGPDTLATSVEAAVAFIRAATPAAFGQMTGNVIPPDDPNGYASVHGTMQVHVQTLLLALAARGVDVAVPSSQPKVPYRPDHRADHYDG
jgi:hypothetical protein